MRGYLIFDLRLAYYFLKKKSFLFNEKNIIFITDKIAIYELFKLRNIKVISLDKVIGDTKRKKIFLSNYQKIDKRIKNLGKKNTYIFDKVELNTIHNTNRFEVPRYYVGIKYLYYSLKIVLKQQNIKEIVYFDDLGFDLLCKNFYTKIFELFCKENNLKFHIKKIDDYEKLNYLNLYSNFLTRIFLRFRDISLFKFTNYFYQRLSNSFYKKFSKRQHIAFVGPKFDFAYLKNNLVSINLNNLLTTTLKKQKKKNLITIPHKEFKNLEDGILWYLKTKNEKNKEFYKNVILKIYTYLKINKIKKIFWGVSPEPLIRNIIEFLKEKNYLVNGIQHGGKYFILNDDLYHKDSDFNLCNNYHSYGFSSSFKKKKYAKNTKILNTGCLKSYVYENTFRKIDKLNNNTILYVPIGLSNFFVPVIETSPSNRFILQREICKKLNGIKNLKKFVKILPLTYFKNINFDYNQLQANPIYFELNKFKSLKINSRSLNLSYEIIKPKIVIMDALSTPLYELSGSDSEIIVFLDKFNQPKSDVLSILKKRFFIVKNVTEMMSCINLILKKNKNRSNNKLFYKKFYKQKNRNFIL